MSDVDCVVGVKDRKLKEFVRLCVLLEGCIGELVRERDSPRVNDDYYRLRSELVKVRSAAIVEAYNSKCLEWKF